LLREFTFGHSNQLAAVARSHLAALAARTPLLPGIDERAWLTCAVIAHNLLRAVGALAGGQHAVARGATLRRDLVNVPARFAAPARKPTLHLPVYWPWQIGWKTLWDNIIGYSPTIPRAG
jgi:hypothetical protein